MIDNTLSDSSHTPESPKLRTRRSKLLSKIEHEGQHAAKEDAKHTNFHGQPHGDFEHFNHEQPQDLLQHKKNASEITTKTMHVLHENNEKPIAASRHEALHDQNLMLIEYVHPQETRIAIVKNKKLYNAHIEQHHKPYLKGNIYWGKIVRIEPSLQAVFVDYGHHKNGFLPFADIHPDFYNHKTSSGGAVRMQSVMRKGQLIPVQVVKEERQNKGASLTTFFTLTGRYAIFLPNHRHQANGISRRVVGEERAHLKDILSVLSLPTGTSVILRSAGIGRKNTEIKQDVERLTKMWLAISKNFQTPQDPQREHVEAIHEDGDVLTRALRDWFDYDLDKIIIEGAQGYKILKEKIKTILPKQSKKLLLHKEKGPIFAHFGVAEEMRALERFDLILPSGASIVINQTEALTAIDINSAKATKASNFEDAALAINLEAAEEIARQIRLRDIGGIIVIDFIDMEQDKHKQAVEKFFKKLAEKDGARTQVGTISRLGLLELSRQRVGHNPRDTQHTVCSKCHGYGTTPSLEFAALYCVRHMADIFYRNFCNKDSALEFVPPHVVDIPIGQALGWYILNHYRAALHQLETQYATTINLRLEPHADSTWYALPEHLSVAIEEPHHVAQPLACNEPGHTLSHSVRKDAKPLAAAVVKSRNAYVNNVDVQDTQPQQKVLTSKQMGQKKASPSKNTLLAQEVSLTHAPSRSSEIDGHSSTPPIPLERTNVRKRKRNRRRKSNNEHGLKVGQASQVIHHAPKSQAAHEAHAPRTEGLQKKPENILPPTQNNHGKQKSGWLRRFFSHTPS